MIFQEQCFVYERDLRPHSHSFTHILSRARATQTHSLHTRGRVFKYIKIFYLKLNHEDKKIIFVNIFYVVNFHVVNIRFCE